METMYPNQPNQLPTPQPPSQQPQPTPLSGSTVDPDYLDTIAAPLPVKTMKPWQLWGIIGSVIALMIIVVMIVANSGGTSNTERYTAYLYRVQALEKLTKDSSKTIQSSQLRALNASTTSNLTTAFSDGSKLLSIYDIKKLPEAKKDNLVINEYTSLSTKLNDARLNSVYDRVYAREIGYQLGALRAEMNTLFKATKNNQLRSYLQKTDANLKPLVDQFNQFNNSQS